MPRLTITTENIDLAFKQARAHLDHHLAEKGPLCLVSTHECSGLIDEEVIELKDAVRGNKPSEFEKECLDLSTASILSIISKQIGGFDR